MRRPSNIREWLVLVVGSAFGLGLLPIAPGSFGALLGIALHLTIVPAFSFPAWFTLAALLVIVSVTHYLLSSAAVKFWNDSDPKNFVLDEIAGYLLTATLLAPWLPSIWIMTAGFLLFRILDIIKPPPARQIDRNMHTATGVLLDDLVSAAYASALLFAFYYFSGRPLL